MNRAYNFAAGPSMLPLSALTTAAEEMTNFRGSGMSVMEMSHRSKIYLEIFDETVALLRELMAIPDDYEVLLLQGGATGQFAAVPLNLAVRGSADYVDSGNFAAGAAKEAAKYTNVNVVASSKADNYTYIPAIDPAKLNPQADYLYITTNNTIFGTRYTNTSTRVVASCSDKLGTMTVFFPPGWTACTSWSAGAAFGCISASCAGTSGAGAAAGSSALGFA